MPRFAEHSPGNHDLCRSPIVAPGRSTRNGAALGPLTEACSRSRLRAMRRPALGSRLFPVALAMCLVGCATAESERGVGRQTFPMRARARRRSRLRARLLRLGGERRKNEATLRMSDHQVVLRNSTRGRQNSGADEHEVKSRRAVNSSSIVKTASGVGSCIVCRDNGRMPLRISLVAVWCSLVDTEVSESVSARGRI